MIKEFNLSKKILFADSRDLIDLNSEDSPNRRKSGDSGIAELITIGDIKEFIERLRERSNIFQIRSNISQIDGKWIMTLSYEEFKELIGDKLI